MLKPILTLSLLISISSICYAQSLYTALHINDRHEYNFGKPQKIIEKKIFHSSKGAEVSKSIKIFDKSGALLTEERYDEQDILTAKLTYINDTVKNLKLSRTFEMWPKYGHRLETAFYSYDEHNFLTSSVDKNETGKIIDVTKIVNNEMGDPIELALFDGDNNSFGKEIAKYDYDKNEVVISIYNNDGSKLSSDTSKIHFNHNDGSSYNQYNDVLSYSTKNFNGSINFYECEYQYDQKGNWLEQRIYRIMQGPNDKQKRVLQTLLKREIWYY
jgi:hypothetical protein